MQTGAAAGTRPTYDLLLKNRALRVLDDYREATGRGWQRIRDEIFDTIRPDASDHAPRLVRQDLESWAAGDSVLGDAKFHLVFQFLTHPSTLARPEFDRASDLRVYGRLRRIGNSFGDFFWDPRNSGFFRTVPPQPLDPARVDRKLQGFEGYFVGHTEGRDHCLALHRLGGENFMIAHLFAWPRVRYGEPRDWEIDRWSGYCTVGSLMRAHLKGVLMRETRDLYLVPAAASRDANLATGYSVLNNSFVTRALEFGVHIGDQPNRLRFIDPRDHTLVLERESGPEIAAFVDQFRWNVPE